MHSDLLSREYHSSVMRIPYVCVHNKEDIRMSNNTMMRAHICQSMSQIRQSKFHRLSILRGQLPSSQLNFLITCN